MIHLQIKKIDALSVFRFFICLFLLNLSFFYSNPVISQTVQIQSDVAQISERDLNNQDRIIYITDQWKFHPGDRLEWANSDFDDSDWETISTFLTEFDLAFIEWEGTGWFRFHLQADSTLVNVPLAILSEAHYGASEIYFDGKKLFDLGEFSIFEEQVVPYHDLIPRSIVFPDTRPHILAVRFANFNPEPFLEQHGSAGFRFILGDLYYHTDHRLNTTMAQSIWQMFFLGGLLAFTLIHVLLFVFYPDEKRNLYFALFTGFLAALSYAVVNIGWVHSPLGSIHLTKFAQIAWILTILYALRFTYSLYETKTPIQFWFFLAVGVLIALASWLNMEQIAVIRELYVFFTVLEMLRMLVKIFQKKESGKWILIVGLSSFLIAIIYRISVNLELIPGNTLPGNYIGPSILILSMSVFLSRDFAITQRKLEKKLSEVKALSKRSLEQERLNKKKEFEKKMLEAENNRKSHELEEARALQLTMLPKKLPNVPDWEMAVFMETATEVGGDYYDYSLKKDGCMTVVIGDATGHGMKAGIMVATAKSYFHTLAGENDNLTILKRMSSGFRSLDLKKLFMGITLLKCENHTVTMSAAGMPPVLWYKKKPNRIERVILKGLPLGTTVDYPYDTRQMDLERGDVLLLMSDGLMELFNDRRDMLGLDRIERTLMETIDYSATDIINSLTGLIELWAGPSGNEDDITLMILKAK